MDLPRLSPFEILTAACAATPERTRFLYLSDAASEQQLTGADLISRSLAFARGLAEISQIGDRILLPYPAGLDFIIGFLGCIAAKRIPVPANYPKPRRPSSRYQAIADNCQATVAVSTSNTLQTLDHSQETNLNWFSAEEIEARGTSQPVARQSEDWQARVAQQLEALEQAELDATEPKSAGKHEHPEDLLFLQYTSGSTSHPKGVMITSANLFSNLRIISHGFGIERIPPEQRIVCSWLPAYHDMGLVGVILSTLVHDAQAILMSPTTFLRNPALWLKSIERFQARITVAPCFGYQWAASRIAQVDADRMDLSCLDLAACGAEPISPAVLNRFASHFSAAGFRKEAFYPCYGLAEATLMVSGDHRGVQARTQNVPPVALSIQLGRTALQQDQAIELTDTDDSIEVVHCGMPALNTELALVSQSTGERCGEGEVGEIVVRSPSVAHGYWDPSKSINQTFHFRFANEEHDYLRTGDLGFLLRGRLYVTGRRKELIIIAGQNFYPHDIEQTVAACHPSLAGLPTAAFAIPGDATERLVLVQEAPRGLDPDACQQIMRKMRLSVASTHELAPFAVVLVRTASIPRTSSGKVQRLQTCQHFLNRQLKVVASWELKAIDDQHLFRDLTPLLKAGNEARLRGRIENTLLRWIVTHTGEDTSFVRPDQAFAEMGVDSLLSVQLGARVRAVARLSHLACRRLVLSNSGPNGGFSDFTTQSRKSRIQFQGRSGSPIGCLGSGANAIGRPLHHARSIGTDG